MLIRKSISELREVEHMIHEAKNPELWNVNPIYGRIPPS
jgi:hypothetical protein